MTPGLKKHITKTAGRAADNKYHATGASPQPSDKPRHPPHTEHTATAGTAQAGRPPFLNGHTKKESLHGYNRRRTLLTKKAATYSPAFHRSTIGASGLNFSVRNGKRWNPAAMTTLFSLSIPYFYIADLSAAF